MLEQGSKADVCRGGGPHQGKVEVHRMWFQRVIRLTGDNRKCPGEPQLKDYTSKVGVRADPHWESLIIRL